MPNIVEYTNKEELTPSDKGINAAVDAAHVYASVGRDIGRDFHEVADKIEHHMAFMETSELYKTGTELKLNLQTRYVKESGLPENRGNPHFGDQFMAEVGPMIDAWGKGAKTDQGKQLAVTFGGNIRNEIFNHVAAGQAEMDYAHVDDNHTQTRNGLASGLITDPSEANLTRTLGTMKAANEAMTATIPDVDMRERAMTEYNDKDMSGLVMVRYLGGVGESIKNQIGETGGDTSPALEQLNKDVKAQLGFQYLSPAEQTRITQLGPEAVRQGQELFNSKNATAKSKLTEEGRAAYADIHTAITQLVLNGQGPTPDLLTSIGVFNRKYGGVLPGEVASLDDFVVRGQDRAQSNAVQPFNQSTRDSIQAGFSLPSGDPRRPSLASLTRDYSHGRITKEDFSGFTEILNKLDKPETDPAFKPAWDSFVRWRDMQIQGIGTVGGQGTAAARAAFIHDSTASFMARGKGKDWDHALKGITDPNTPGNFGGAIRDEYKKAAQFPDSVGWLKSHWHTWDENGMASPLARGSSAAPVYPTNRAAPAHTPTPAADLKKADEILWGKH